jgi:hypothetical protein
MLVFMLVQILIKESTSLGCNHGISVKNPLSGLKFQNRDQNQLALLIPIGEKKP